MNFLKNFNVLLSTSRRCFYQQNFRLLSSTTIQPAENAQNELLVKTLQHEAPKDKLYSRLEIELRGIEPKVMCSYAWFATRSAKHLGIQVGKCYALDKSRKDKWTLLKSVFVHAKHLVSYEVRTYYRFLNFHNLTQSTLETYLEYLQRNLPEGTAMKATKVELQKLPEHLKPN